LMLASTMQFSRYGRPRDKTRRIHGGQSRSRRRNSFRPFPQDPTACQAISPPPPVFPSPEGRTS
jgi:hypothetical protein